MEKLKTRYYNLQNLSIFLSYIPIFKSIFNNEFECSIENSGRLKRDYFEKSYLMRLVIYSTLNMSSWNMSAKISIDQVLRNKSRVINNATAEKLQVHLLILIKIFLEIILKLFWTKEYPTVIIPTLQNFVSSLKLHH